MKDISKRKAVRRTERQNNRVFGGCSLQFEIKFAAEALAQRQSPRPVQSAAERSVNDELHAAGFVKKTLEYDVLLRRHHTESDSGDAEILSDLFRSARCDADLCGEPGGCFSKGLQRVWSHCG